MEEVNSMNKDFEVIICIVNSGFADDVMSAAREAGAKGGTVINARGTARQEAEKKYGIVFEPEKEMVIILVEKRVKEDILHSIYKKVGLNSPGQGIAFSLPVDDVVGISPINLEVKEDKE
jgi:nitrogen regulatory protein PII